MQVAQRDQTTKGARGLGPARDPIVRNRLAAGQVQDRLRGQAPAAGQAHVLGQDRAAGQPPEAGHGRGANQGLDHGADHTAGHGADPAAVHGAGPATGLRAGLPGGHRVDPVASPRGSPTVDPLPRAGHAAGQSQGKHNLFKILVREEVQQTDSGMNRRMSCTSPTLSISY